MSAALNAQAFAIAAQYNSIPIQSSENDDAITVVLMDGRKIVLEKENGTKKRIQRAEAEQAKIVKAEAEREVAQARKELEAAEIALQSAAAEEKRLQDIADGKPQPVAVAPAKKKEK